PEGNKDQRRKAANDIWRKFKNKKQITTVTPKRLFYDIETSYNIVKSWRVGYNLNINPDDIIHERAIICVSYKWEGEDTVYTLKWKKGDDSELVRKFIKVMAEADELIGHNIDRYDTKFLMTRAIKNNILALPKYTSTDTLKLARKHFSFNSNKLDYIAEFLGFGNKLKHRGMPMWDDIILRNCSDSMNEMIDYCEKDVLLTEQVYNKLISYGEQKTHHGVLNGKEKCSCPNCGDKNFTLVKTYVSKVGTSKKLVKCDSCK